MLVLLGEHLTNAQIARRLHLSVRTVENHVSALLRKTGVPGRRELARVAAGRAVATVPSGPPTPRTSFVGRAVELDLLAPLLTGGGLVTLAGPGGVGKTRLAAAAASSVAIGAVWVDLVPVREGFAAQAVAAALGAAETPQLPLREAIAARLGARRLLLVLDNCEHLLDEAASLAELVLDAGPAATVLATSRERLGVAGERVVHVAPLPLGSDAEALFSARAPGLAGDLALVARVCSRLDGLPLAIELAAARGDSLGAVGLLAALDDPLRLLSGARGGQARHRSLREVIAWSHDLLAPAEQVLLARLSVFAGPFDLTAVAAVCEEAPATVADLLGRLADQSLITAQPGTGRWRLLEAVRAFAAERLDARAEAADVRTRHVSWAREAAIGLSAFAPGWREVFDALAADLREAARGDHGTVRALARLTFARRFLRESFEHYLTAARLAPSPMEAHTDLMDAAEAVFSFGHAEASYRLLLDAAAAARDAGAGNAEAAALAAAVTTAGRLPSGFTEEIPYTEMRAMLTRARSLADPGDPLVTARLAAATTWTQGPARLTADAATASTAHEAALATGDPILISAALDALSSVAAHHGDLAEADRLARRRLALLPTIDRTRPASAAEILDIHLTATQSALATGDLPAARRNTELILDDDLLKNHPYRATSRHVAVLVLQGELDEAVALAPGLLDGWRRSGSPAAAWMSPGASCLVLAHALLGDEASAAAWRRVAQTAGGHGSPGYARNAAAFATFVDARLALHTTTAHDLTPASGRYADYANAALAELAVSTGDPRVPELLALAEESAPRNAWAAATVLRARARLSGDYARAVAAWDGLGARFEAGYTRELESRATR
ncbi:hypothetical protein Afil01_32160 [Actinorhabdospora filicis]|uniref:HTH luxR-type domain-containing protein n=1 Tax=Actinorhabdospora filicis TaxID=1785913 RepID=A0A9W6W9B0_9ACTN|nr:hypothetical protein Afil01_32160 [Actinorhabdospora filicis]